jgi:arsenite methyltransferase
VSRTEDREIIGAAAWPRSAIGAGSAAQEEDDMLDFVQKYYGEMLEKTGDLKTSACCTVEAPPDYVTEALGRIHEDVSSRYYGCGLVLPEALTGTRILDLGCGSGRDCYLLSQLVGEQGEVVGVDMTEEQLAVATQYAAYHADRFGYGRPNVAFHNGYIEKLDALPLEPGSFDLIVSNCVVNLSPDKAAVLRGAYRLLKPGGELYFADVYADRRVPAEVARDPVLYGECLGGALYWNDFLNLAKGAGFPDPRLVSDREIEITDPRLKAAVRGVRFYSATYRLFKLPELEPACEDYGQAVVYKGTIDHYPDEFVLDGHHVMQTGRIFPVCGNTFDILSKSRLVSHFDFIGDKSKHFGIFPGCGTTIPFGSESTDPSEGSSGACC